MSSDPGPRLDPQAALSAALGDRRFALRVPVGRPVRVWNRFHRVEARLVDLSLSGCRLLCQEPVNTGFGLWLWLPRGMGGRLPHPVRGQVAWSESVAGQRTGVCHVAVRFRPMLAGTTPRIHRALAGFVTGDCERRVDDRVAYGRRVITRGSSGPRVLVGQDLSVSGMRIAGAEGLEIGTEVQLALHAGGLLPPLVVDARVVRRTEQGDAGLEFIGLDTDREQHLRKLVHEHPQLIGPNGQPAVVGELVGEE